MTSEQIIGAIVISLPSILITAGLGVYTVRKNRQTGAEANHNNADANDNARFNTFLTAYERQRADDAARITALTERVDELSEAAAAQGRQLTSIKTVVQRWFARLWAEWNHDAGPMPLPSTEELALLELRIPPK